MDYRFASVCIPGMLWPIGSVNKHITADPGNEAMAIGNLKAGWLGGHMTIKLNIFALSNKVGLQNL